MDAALNARSQMERPRRSIQRLVRLLDWFCCEGGAGMGYHRAGFDITGVDIEPRKLNPHPVIEADAVEYLLAHGHEYDAIHASPPCQSYSRSFNAIHAAAWLRFKTPQDADVFANALKIIAAVAKKRSWQLGAKEWAQAYVDAIAILKQQQAKRV